MKILLVQKDITNGEIKTILDDVSDSDADLVLFNELAPTGCLYNGAEESDFPQIKDLSELCTGHPFEVMIGTPRWENGLMYNSYIYYGKDSTLIYDKINLFEPMNEHLHYQPGQRSNIFDTKYGKFGVTICYDVRFHALFDGFKKASVDYILAPAAFPRVRINAYKKLLKEHAINTGKPVIAINAVGDDGTNEFGGSSMVIDNTGKIMAQADEVNETIIEVEL
ncbi:MAG: hypothetical protein DWP97_13995 [Calditrichaeota bacterium]|nr:MAG: hypothetical protein DWP97_13995 [Calditrichota bacterium]